LAKGRKTGGRRAGTPNKIAAEVRAAILDAFVQAGGSSYLVRVANENPAAFCALLRKLLPTGITTDGPITQEIVLGWMTPEMAHEPLAVAVVQSTKIGNSFVFGLIRAPGLGRIIS
jgi:Lysine 2,3-aminomutase